MKNLFNSSALIILLITLVTYSQSVNIDNGQFNTILSGQNNNIRSGIYNVIDGWSNDIDGSSNFVGGNSNFVAGDNNFVVGTGNKIAQSVDEFYKALNSQNRQFFLTGPSSFNSISNSMQSRLSNSQQSETKFISTDSAIQRPQVRNQNPVEGPTFDINFKQQIENHRRANNQLQNNQNSWLVKQQKTIDAEIRSSPRPETNIKGTSISIDTPTLSKQQIEPKSSFGISGNRDQTMNKFLNLVQVKEVVESSPEELAKAVDVNSNYGIKEPVRIKEATQLQTQKPSGSQSNISYQNISGSGNYEKRPPVQIKQIDQKDDFLLSEQFVGIPSNQKEEDEGPANSSWQESSDKEEKTQRQNQEWVKAQQPMKLQLQNQHESQKPLSVGLNLRGYFNFGLIRQFAQGSLVQASSHQQYSQMRGLNENSIPKVKFVEVGYESQTEGTIRPISTSRPITKQQYVEKTFTLFE